MKFTGTLTSLRIDIAAYKSAMNKYLTDAIQAAAREWLSATAATIPVWSGASVRTFRDLASAVNYPLSISPVRGSHPPADFGENVGRVTADASKGQYTFEYSTTLAHLVYNEYFNANEQPDAGLIWRLKDPGPYDFQEHGKEAFKAYAAGVKLPNPFLYVKPTRIRIG